MKNNILRTVFFLILPLWVISCGDKETEDYPLLRTFRPIQFSQSVTENTVIFKWLPIANVTYVLEISRDSLVFERDLASFSFANADEFYVEDLWSGQRYSARIKAINNNPAIPESQYSSKTFVTGYENIITEQVVDFDKITLSWAESRSGVDRIVASATGLEAVTVILSNEDKSAREKDITGLQPGTSYTIRIYLGERLRGTVTAKTLSVQ